MTAIPFPVPDGFDPEAAAAQFAMFDTLVGALPDETLEGLIGFLQSKLEARRG